MRRHRARRALGEVPDPAGAEGGATEVLMPALLSTVGALDPPPADDALVAVALVVASVIDSMSAADRMTMMVSHAGVLVKVLDALERRAAARVGVRGATARSVPVPMAGGADPLAWEKRQAARIVKLRRGGLTVAQIGEKLKWHPDAVRLSLEAYGDGPEGA